MYPTFFKQIFYFISHILFNTCRKALSKKYQVITGLIFKYGLVTFFITLRSEL